MLEPYLGMSRSYWEDSDWVDSYYSYMDEVIYRLANIWPPDGDQQIEAILNFEKSLANVNELKKYCYK